MRVVRIVLTCALAVAAPGVAAAAPPFLVVTQHEGGYRFIAAETVTVNGKDKIRIADGLVPGAAVDKRQFDRFPERPLTEFDIIRVVKDRGLVATERGDSWQLILPRDFSAKTAQRPADLWQQAVIAIKKDKDQQTPDVIALGELYAIIPTTRPADSAVDLITRPEWFAAGEPPGPQHTAQALRAVPGAVEAYRATRSMARLRDHLVAGLRRTQQAWLAGGAPRSTLDNLIDYAEAAAVFPDDRELPELRHAALKEKAAFERRVATLNALRAGGHVNPFLTKYLDFEPFDASLDELRKQREESQRESARMHFELGTTLYKQRDFSNAIANLRLAARRDPAVPRVLQLLDEVRLEAARVSSRQVAERRRGLDVRAPLQVQVQRHLLMAEQLAGGGKAADAQAEIEAAVALDPDAPGVVFARAKVLAAKGELGAAVATMDRYAAVATTDTEFTEGEKYRGTLLFRVQDEKAKLRIRLREAFEASQFASALQAASVGLKLDNEDGEFLFQAGVTACLLRRCDDGKPLLQKYLELSDSVTSDKAKRQTAMRLLAHVPPTLPTLGAGPPTRSWFSGASVGGSAVYDPVSMAFVPKVATIQASNKLSVAYEWSGPTLLAVKAKYENNHTGSNIFNVIAGAVASTQGVDVGPVTIQNTDRETNEFYFQYLNDAGQVVKVSHEKTAVKGGTQELAIAVPVIANGIVVSPGDVQAYTSQESQESSDSAKGFVTLANSSRVDARLAYELTGKRVTIGFSGNSYFHPFAWDGTHLFEFDYDERGRVRKAWEQDKGTRVDFSWYDDDRLREIVVSEDKPNGAVLYTRTLNYERDRLDSETIRFNGKSAKIEYRYNKQGKMIAADCDEDPSLDSRSRRVEIVP